MAEDSSATISEDAQGPRRASGDSGSVEKYSIPDRLKLIRFRASEAAVGSAFKRCGRQKIVPPGAS